MPRKQCWITHVANAMYGPLAKAKRGIKNQAIHVCSAVTVHTPYIRYTVNVLSLSADVTDVVQRLIQTLKLKTFQSVRGDCRRLEDRQFLFL